DISLSTALRSKVLPKQVAMVVTYLQPLLFSVILIDFFSLTAALLTITTVVHAYFYITVESIVFLMVVCIEALWAQGLSMIAFAVVGLGLAVAAFRKQIAR